MARGRRKGQSEINLGAGHVAGMFLAVVVLCGIFFTLGYVLGRGSSPAKTASANARSSFANAEGNPASGSGSPSAAWDFFPKKSTSNGLAASRIPPLTPQPSGAQPQSGPVSMTAKPAGVHIERRPPLLRGGRTGYLLQVAAMKDRGDALALAGFLKQKGYPAFAWGPAADLLYRVQVGPYPNSKSAGAVRIDLEKQGFQSILKH